MGIKVEEKLSEDVSGQSQTHGCLNGNFYQLMAVLSPLGAVHIFCDSFWVL